MKKIRVDALDKTIEVNDGDNLLDCLLKNNIFVESPCNKKGTCGKCRLIIKNKSFEISSLDKNFLSHDELNKGIRLACDKKVFEDLEIQLIKKEEKGKVLTTGYLPEFEIDTNREGLGIAIDIGTTTVAMDLVDLKTGKILDSESLINPQKIYGSDVLTRITYEVESGQEGIENLQKVIVNAINEGIEKFNINKDRLKEIVVAANTTMAHMFLGVDARSLGKYPYQPAFIELQEIKAKNIGINGGENTILTTLPHVSAFIGADIVAGAYICNLDKVINNQLFIDIGTNGEIVLSKNGKLLCCSCAAGPALEGMNISSGMRAEAGAIEDIVITKDKIDLKVIDNVEPVGICGSGILATIRELIKHKMIKENGAIIKKEDLPEDDYRQKYIGQNGKKREIILSENPKIIMTQGDIRSVQLAKGAILSGFMTLLKKGAITMKDLSKVLVAGQFGSHLPNTSLVGTGILPKEVFSKIVYLGNTSKSGAYMALLSKKVKKEIQEISKKMEYVELAVFEGYEDIFRESLYYPIELDIDKIS